MALSYEAVIRLRDQVSGPAQTVRRNINQMSGSIQKAQQRIRAQRDASMQLAGNLTIAGSGAVEAGRKLSTALKSPTDVAISFEKAMSKVHALTRLDLGIPAQARQLEALKQKALSLGDSTSFSASQVAAGQSFLAMAGFNPEKIIAAMPGMLNLAKSGDMDLATTADISSNIMSGFGMKAGQIDHIGDVMAYTFTTSNLNMRQLGETMKYVAPIASKTGASLETVAAMSGALGDVGLQGSMAGTALRSAFLRLADPPKEARKALRKLGVDVKNSAGKMRPMLDVLKDLKKRLSPLQNGAQIEAISTIFGAEAAGGMTELVMNIEKVIKKRNDILKEANGTSARVAKIMGENTAGKVNKLKSAVEGLQISLGNYLLPHLNESIEKVTGFVRRSQIWIKHNPLLVSGIIKVAIVLGKLITGAGMLLIALSAVIGPLAMLRYAVKMAGLSLFSMGSRVTWFSRILGLIKIAGIASVISLLGIGSAFAYTGEDAADFAQRIPVIGEWLTEKLPTIAQKAKASLEIIKAALRGDEWAVNIGWGGIAAMLGWLALGVNPAIKLKEVLSSLTKTSTKLWRLSEPALLKLSALVSVKLKNAYATLQRQINNGQVDKIIIRLGNIAKNVGQNMMSFGRGIYQVGAGIARSVVWLKNAVGGWENLGKVIAVAYVMAKISAFLGALSAVISIISGLAGLIATVAGAIALVSLPILAVVLVVAVLAYGVYWLYQNWGMVKKSFLDSSWGQRIIGWITKLKLAVMIFKLKIQELKQWWEDVKQAFRDSSWGSAILSMLDFVTKGLNKTIRKIQDVLGWFGLIKDESIKLDISGGVAAAPKVLQAVQTVKATSVIGRVALEQVGGWEGLKGRYTGFIDTVKIKAEEARQKQQAQQTGADNRVEPIRSPVVQMQSFMHELKGQHELTLNLKAAPGVSYSIEKQKTTGSASKFNLGNQAGADR